MRKNIRTAIAGNPYKLFELLKYLLSLLSVFNCHRAKVILKCGYQNFNTSLKNRLQATAQPCYLKEIIKISQPPEQSTL